MAGNFNIRDRDWVSLYPFHSTCSDILFNIVDSFDLKLLCSIQQVPTHYFDNFNDVNLVINLFFLYPNSIEFDNHIIILELWYLSDHALLTVDISITEEFIQDKYQTIIRSSEKEENFIPKPIKALGNINTSIIPDKDFLNLEFGGIKNIKLNLGITGS